MNLNLKFRLIRDIVCIPLHLLSVLGILITLGCKRHPFDTLQLKWIGYITRRWIREKELDLSEARLREILAEIHKNK